MAKMLSSLLEDDDTRREIGDYCMHKAKQWFDMESYIRKIQQLGERPKIEQKEIAKNFKYLIEMNAINMEYCYKNEINKEYCTQHYLYSWKNNIGKRKPFPGFHPGIYREKAIDINSKEDPLVHYLKSEKPKGEWFSDLIESNKDMKILTNTKVAIHIHVHYIDILEEIFRSIRYNQTEPDIYITYNNKLHKEYIIALARKYELECCSMILTPNKGRDIGPFITDLGKILDSTYQVYGHIHTKKSLHIDKHQADMWRKFLLVNLLGDAKNKNDGHNSH